ncbi:MAG: CHAT domain-containing protein [Bacteroidota bacterium]
MQEFTFELNSSLIYSTSALELFQKGGFHLDAAKEHHKRAILYGYLQRPDLQATELRKAKQILTHLHDCSYTEDDKAASILIELAFARNQVLSSFRTLRLGDTSMAMALADTAWLLLDEAVEKAEILEPVPASIIALQANFDKSLMGIQLPLEYGRHNEIMDAFDFSISLLDGQLLQLVQKVNKAHFLSRKTEDCSSFQDSLYNQAVESIDGIDPESASITDLRIRNGLSKYLSALECSCAEIDDDASLAANALQRAEQTMTDYETFLGRIDTEPSQEALLGDWHGNYLDAVDIVMRSNRILKNDEYANVALSLSNRSKSVALSSALRNRSRMELYDQKYLEIYQLLNELKSNRDQAINQNKVAEAKDAQDQISYLYTNLIPLKDSTSRQLFRDIAYGYNFTNNDVQNDLPNYQTAAIDIFYGRGEIVIHTITKTSQRQFTSTVDISFINAWRAIKNHDATGNDAAKNAYKIYQKILEPAIQWIRQQGGINQLIIARDKMFTDFAFDYFPTDEPKEYDWSGSRLLIDEFAITYVYSLPVYTNANSLMANRSRSRKEWVGFTALQGFETAIRRVEALPALYSRVTEISNRYFTSNHFYKNCTKDIFLDEVEQAKFITVCTHGYENSGPTEGYFMQMHPSLSYPSGEIRNEDIYPLNLSADLSLLINCHSAEGEIFTAEGEKSLARAFMFAGSLSVIAGNDLLKDNMVSYLLSKFHKYWIDEGLSSANALRLAKLDARSAFPGTPPERWGSLLHYGLLDIYYD